MALVAGRSTPSVLRGLKVTKYQLRVLTPRHYSADLQPPALLKTLKTDLKTAMRAKDGPRLSAIRGVLTAVTNSEKTDKPIQTDQQMVALMQKQLRTMAEAVGQFKHADRQDLVDKEEATMKYLREYISNSGIRVVEGDELARIIRGAVRAAKASGEPNQGALMKSLLGAGGVLEGNSVNKAEVARLVKEALAS